MSVRIITGHTGTNHITSLDGRAQNRALIGNGKLIFDDEYKACVDEINDSTAKIKFRAGSLLWNGVFIRIEEGTEVSFNLPSAETTINVYLIYHKVDGIESIEMSTIEQAESDLTEESNSACAKYFSFVWMGVGDHRNTRYYFSQIDSLTTSSIVVLSTFDSIITSMRRDMDSEIREAKEEMNELISDAESRANAKIVNLSYNLKDADYIGEYSGNQSEYGISLNGKLWSDYESLFVIFDNYNSAIVPCPMLKLSNQSLNIPISSSSFDGVNSGNSYELRLRANGNAYLYIASQKAYSISKSLGSWSLESKTMSFKLYGCGKVAYN